MICAVVDMAIWENKPMRLKIQVYWGVMEKLMACDYGALAYPPTDQ